MTRAWMPAASRSLSGMSLACWILMFLAGTDVWHDTGRVNFWNLQGPPYTDLRAFVVTFYVLGALLIVHVLMTWVLRERKRTDELKSRHFS